MKQKTILVITDGIGYSENAQFNAFATAKKPTYEWLFKNVPNALIKTSGLAVGLPEGQMGNSEVGHMCIGSGRVLYQNLVKISLGFENGSLAKSEKLLNLFKNAKPSTSSGFTAMAACIRTLAILTVCASWRARTDAKFTPTRSPTGAT